MCYDKKSLSEYRNLVQKHVSVVLVSRPFDFLKRTKRSKNVRYLVIRANSREQILSWRKLFFTIRNIIATTGAIIHGFDTKAERGDGNCMLV